MIPLKNPSQRKIPKKFLRFEAENAFGLVFLFSNFFFLTGLGIVRCDIPGLVSRVDKPLDFLGLYKTEHEASLRAHIPAKEISGEVIESHMLSAAKRYFHRSEVLDSVLAGFYHKVRTEEGQEDCQDIW